MTRKNTAIVVTQTTPNGEVRIAESLPFNELVTYKEKPIWNVSHPKYGNRTFDNILEAKALFDLITQAG